MMLVIMMMMMIMMMDGDDHAADHDDCGDADHDAYDVDDDV